MRVCVILFCLSLLLLNIFKMTVVEKVIKISKQSMTIGCLDVFLQQLQKPPITPEKKANTRVWGVLLLLHLTKKIKIK